jgi:hypothetical protein
MNKADGLRKIQELRQAKHPGWDAKAYSIILKVEFGGKVENLIAHYERQWVTQGQDTGQ